MTVEAMIRRFCAYSALRNLRFFDAFVVPFLLHDLKLDYAEVGAFLAYEKLLMGLLEVPLAVVTDRVGRRRSLVQSFLLAAVAMMVFGIAGQTATPLAVALVAQTIYAVAEALRTGTHKAMILDYLTAHGLRDRRVEVLGRTRFFTESSTGVAALIGGVLVWLTGGFSALFFAAAVPTAIGAGLISTYPSELEGEIQRERKPAEALPLGERLRRGLGVLTRPGLAAVLVPSIIFESQIKLAGYYLQPALATGLERADLVVAGGVGALAFGLYALVSGLLAGFSSLLSTRLVAWAGSVARGLTAAYVAATFALLLTAIGLIAGALFVGLAFLLGLAALQNARRPIFIAAIDDVMDPRYRATTISVESQARSWLYALTALGAGLLADHFGLGAAFALMAALMVVGLFTPRGHA